MRAEEERSQAEMRAKAAEEEYHRDQGIKFLEEGKKLLADIALLGEENRTSGDVSSIKQEIEEFLKKIYHTPVEFVYKLAVVTGAHDATKGNAAAKVSSHYLKLRKKVEEILNEKTQREEEIYEEAVGKQQQATTWVGLDDDKAKEFYGEGLALLKRIGADSDHRRVPEKISELMEQLNEGIQEIDRRAQEDLGTSGSDNDDESDDEDGPPASEPSGPPSLEPSGPPPELSELSEPSEPPPSLFSQSELEYQSSELEDLQAEFDAANAQHPPLDKIKGMKKLLKKLNRPKFRDSSKPEITDLRKSTIMAIAKGYKRIAEVKEDYGDSHERIQYYSDAIKCWKEMLATGIQSLENGKELAQEAERKISELNDKIDRLRSQPAKTKKKAKKMKSEKKFAEAAEAYGELSGPFSYLMRKDAEQRARKVEKKESDREEARAFRKKQKEKARIKQAEVEAKQQMKQDTADAKQKQREREDTYLTFWKDRQEGEKTEAKKAKAEAKKAKAKAKREAKEAKAEAKRAAKAKNKANNKSGPRPKTPQPTSNTAAAGPKRSSVPQKKTPRPAAHATGPKRSVSQKKTSKLTSNTAATGLNRSGTVPQKKTLQLTSNTNPTVFPQETSRSTSNQPPNSKLIVSDVASVLGITG